MMATRLSNLERAVLKALVKARQRGGVEAWKGNRYRDWVYYDKGPKVEKTYSDNGPYLDWDYWFGDTDDEARLFGKRVSDYRDVYWDKDRYVDSWDPDFECRLQADRPDWYTNTEPHDDSYDNWGYADKGMDSKKLEKREYVTLDQVLSL